MDVNTESVCALNAPVPTDAVFVEMAEPLSRPEPAVLREAGEALGITVATVDTPAGLKATVLAANVTEF